MNHEEPTDKSEHTAHQDDNQSSATHDEINNTTEGNDDNQLSENHDEINNTAEGNDDKQLSENHDEINAQDNEIASTEVNRYKKEIDGYKDKLKRAQTGMKDELLRAQADMQNLRKRHEKEIADLHKYALSPLIKELLPIIDSMEQGLKYVQQTDSIEDIHQGMENTMKLFADTLMKFGVKQLNPLDQKFNPEQHQAIASEAVADKDSNIVIEVIQNGYELNDRLMRAAMVKISK